METSGDLHIRMEELVNDLSHALEETACSSTSRRRWGLCRRTRSTGNISMVFRGPQSDDSSNSISEALLVRDRTHSSLHQSDSDDVGPMSGVIRRSGPFNLQSRKGKVTGHGNLESDSVNENFSPVRPGTRRKRKLKRMAVDAMTDRGNVPSTSAGHRIEPSLPGPLSPLAVPPGIGLKKKRVLRHSANCENSFNTVICGKRKRSLRERSAGGCDVSMNEDGSSRTKNRGRLRVQHIVASDDRMEMSGAELTSSSLSLSSSESDAGFFTTDEGREADDEQSDWFGGDGAVGRGWWEEDDDEGAGASPSRDSRDKGAIAKGAIAKGAIAKGAIAMAVPDNDPAFQALLEGSFKHMSESSKRAFADRVSWLKTGMGDRTIRAGRRRLGDTRAGFSVLTSANEKLSRFLQDPSQLELRLHPMQQQERDQLLHLANLYSLQMRTEGTTLQGLTCPVLTKTRDTMRVKHVGAFSRKFHSHGELGLKRCRKTPPTPGSVSSTPVTVGQSAEPLPDSNVGNQMLRSMGWQPGTGLGPDGGGLQEPVEAIIRPRRQGLGHTSS